VSFQIFCNQMKSRVLAFAGPNGLEGRAHSYLCIFQHFPFRNSLTAIKCRQFSVLGLTRGSLGSFKLPTPPDH
jgi:hypothetical protein